ncbi:hypothetical protein Clacol_003468 [Clathrus columnatus]|uniref:DUF6533 domain-containing protein n=1 Tax=Clathrus columnatus TaxID=1419009 RepID=A0AAV5A9M6_9AGAM|nr:hypothetical protein Clacol_003468 [Clathrus columnatus]
MNVTKGCPEGDTECLSFVNTFITETLDLYATDCFGLASFVVLVYDHFLTFDDEVEFVWKAKWSKTHSLFFLSFGKFYLPNYWSTLNVNPPESVSHSPGIYRKSGRCHHFVRYEGAMTMIGISIAAIIMGLRGSWASASAWIPLVYDTAIVLLVLFRATPLAKASIVGQDILVKRLLRDGLVYYGFQLLITVTMISRVTLNLRKHLQESNAQRLPTVQARVSTSSTAKNDAITMMSPIPLVASPQAVYILDIRRQRVEFELFQPPAPQ